MRWLSQLLLHCRTIIIIIDDLYSAQQNSRFNQQRPQNKRPWYISAFCPFVSSHLLSQIRCKDFHASNLTATKRWNSFCQSHHSVQPSTLRQVHWTEYFNEMRIFWNYFLNSKLFIFAEQKFVFNLQCWIAD